MRRERRPVRARPLLVYILALSAATTLPLLALVVTLTVNWISSEDTRLRATMHAVADHAYAQVDRCIGGQIAMLQALATSPAIDGSGLGRFDEQARELASLHGLTITLRTLDGRRMVDTRNVPDQEWGDMPLDAADRRVIETRSPQISDLIVAPPHAPRARIVVPVIRDGEVRYLLATILRPAHLSALLREAGVRPPNSASVVDRAGLIIARASEDDAHVGTTMPGFAMAVGEAGEWSGRNPSGILVYASYRRSKLSGWLLAVGVDQSVLTAPLSRSLWSAGLLAGVLALVIFFVSGWIARRIILAQREVEAAAVKLGDGELVLPPHTLVRETNRIGKALAEASARLHDQAEAVLTANRDLEERVAERTRQVSDQADLIHTTLDSMDQGLMLIDATGRVPICNRRALELLELPAAFMATTPKFTDVLRYQLQREDFERSDVILKQWVERGGLEGHQHTYERERPNGIVLEIRTVPLARGGAVRTYTDITARKQAERQSVYLARHDPLTSLPNRTLLIERLGDELRRIGPKGGQFALLCLDLDRFKAVNDKYGHPTGDALLRLVTERILAAVGPKDVVVRLGGDEFAVLQMEARQPGGACDLAEEIIAAIQQPFQPEGHEVRIGASIGIAIAPADGADVDTVLKHADLALYRAKSEGRNALRCYEAGMDAALQAHQALELDLRQALAVGELELYYQPVVRLPDTEVVGFEALARWHHPVRGMVMPGEFIPIAEDTRLIVPLGTWALHAACREATTWPGEIRVLVNISPIQIEDPAFVATVVAAVVKSGLAPSRLQLEITETVLMRESEGVLQALHALRDFGVRIALDDFGTGHSSLNYLRQFPLDGVKIDRSFVAGVQDTKTAAILSAITSLGRGFGMSVTAEGVETQAQLDFVLAAGCTEGQGYLFGRPMEPARAAQFARRPGATRAA